AAQPSARPAAAFILSAWSGARGPGLLAAMPAAIGADILFLPPAGIGVLSDDLFALVALLAEAILIVELTVRLRTARELARHEAESAELARREASFGLQVRAGLLAVGCTTMRG